MNAPIQPPLMDSWESRVGAADGPVADGGDPNPPSCEPTAADDGISTHKMHVPQITLITKRDTPALMSKRISLDGEGKLKSDGSECRMITGTAARAFAGTASALAQIIANCRSEQAIALGALKTEFLESVAVTIPSRLDKHLGAITRSRSCIDYQRGVPAWCLIDFDTKGMPDESRPRSMRRAACGTRSLRWRLNSRAPHVSAEQAQAPAFFGATPTSRSPVQTACIITCWSATAVMSSGS